MKEASTAWWPVALALGVLAVLAVAASIAVVWRIRTGARRRDAELAASQRALARLMDELPEAVLLVDESGVVSRANRTASSLLGAEPRAARSASSSASVAADQRGVFDYEIDDPTGTIVGQRSVLAGQQLSSLVPIGVETQVARWVEGLFYRSAGASSDVDHDAPIDGERDTLECVVGGDDGARTLVFTGSVHEGESPRVATVVVRDHTATTVLNGRLALAQLRFERVLAGAPTGIALARISDGRIVAANDSLAVMLAMPAELLVGCTLREFTHPDDIAVTQQLHAQLEIGAVERFTAEQRFRRSDGDHIWARVHVSVHDDDGLPVEVVHVENITDHVLISERLRHAERHDELTSLPNLLNFRQLLDERLQHRTSDGSGDRELSVLFADLDRFRYVNDSLGHDAGDRVLREFARRLREALPPEATLARFGADEFIIVSDTTPDPVAAAVRSTADEPFRLDDQELFFTVSIGVAVAGDEPTTVNDLIRDADTALTRAKRRGGNAVELFHRGGTDVPSLVLQTTGEIRRGLARGEFVPYFQPIINLRSGEVTGHEALVRWLHPDRGLLHPDEFMPLVEEAGLVGDLGSMMLREALARAVLWDNEPRFAALRPTMSVNISTHQLLDPNFLPTVVSALTESTFAPGRVWLEITEHSLLADEQYTADKLTDLRSLGLHLAVDDFGTGYSSLTYLKRFPVEAIKIDKTFVRGLGIDVEDSSIVEAVARLGQSLGLTVIAEGVESPLQLQRLRDLDVDQGQGYLFGRARPANLIELSGVLDVEPN